VALIDSEGVGAYFCEVSIRILLRIQKSFQKQVNKCGDKFRTVPRFLGNLPIRVRHLRTMKMPIIILPLERED